jgi:NAD(P)-dependent dehydrogenase (short-subunit alcohol dehydrogenase family)
MDDARGTVCVVTGASSGIGRAVALALAGMGALPVMLSRDRPRGGEAHRQARRLNPEAVWIPTDLSSPDSVRETAGRILDAYGRCYRLFNCAGVLSVKRRTSAGGLELMFAVNYLGHFLLTNLLFPALRAGAPSRVITVSGRRHRPAPGLAGRTVRLEDLQGKRRYRFARQARQSVTARILFTYELSRRWTKQGVGACTVCPGLVRTGLAGELPLPARAAYRVGCVLKGAVPPERAAAYLLDLAFRRSFEQVNGRYFEARAGRLVEAISSPESRDPGLAGRLWEISELLAGPEAGRVG